MMKKFFTLLFYSLFAAVIFSGCSKDDDGDNKKPGLVFMTGAEYTSAAKTIEVGETILIGWTATSNTSTAKELASFEAYVTNASSGLKVQDFEKSNLEESYYAVAYNLTLQSVGVFNVIANVTDAAGEKASLTLKVTVTEEGGGGNNGGGITTDGKISGKLKLVEYTYDTETGEDIFTLKGDVTDEVDQIAAYTWEVDGDEDDVILGTYAVADGSFSFTLPTPNSQYQYLLSESMPDGVTLSDNSVKITDLGFYTLKNGEEVSYIEIIKSNLTYETEVFFMYADRDVTVNGSYESDDDEGETENIYLNKFNMTLKKGWNTIVSKETVSGNTYTYTYTANNMPSDVIWTVMQYVSPEYDKVSSNDVKKASKLFKR